MCVDVEVGQKINDAYSVFVTLTPDELTEAQAVGKARHHVHTGCYDNKVLRNGEDVHIQGAIGELVVAKHFNLPWDGKLKSYDEWLSWRKNGHDVSGLEVRFTKHRYGCLLLHPKDHDNHAYLLVIQVGPCNFEIVGWCLGQEGKKPINWKDVGYGRPCYFVPQASLHHIKHLFNTNTDQKHIPQAG